MVTYGNRLRTTKLHLTNDLLLIKRIQIQHDSPINPELRVGSNLYFLYINLKNISLFIFTFFNFQCLIICSVSVGSGFTVLSLSFL